jgi:TPR repeat protein
MANRKELPIIRAARAGQASAQLTLGKHYLFGDAGLPKNLPTALYWLDRAAHQDEQDAWLLIGSHVPFETAQQATQPSKLCVWYERAYDAGVAQAGLVLAKLVLGQVKGAVSEAMRNKAFAALQTAAQAGIAEAQWLLAQYIGQSETGAPSSVVPAKGGDPASDAHGAMLDWATRAAHSGVPQARHALADHAWATADYPAFLRWALPLARQLMEAGKQPEPIFHQPSEHDVSLVSRCAQALFVTNNFDPNEVSRLWEYAAQAGDRNAQCSFGLWFAKMEVNGERIAKIPGTANYKKAIRWLSLSGEQGLAEAWYALSRIYLKPECSQRNLAGYCAAQLELGMSAWRTRREQESKDVHAVYWLQKAAAQGSREAQTLLDKIATRAKPAQWAQAALQHMGRDAATMYPFLVARIELAALFGLSRPEALLLDLKEADRGHCLLVDIRAQHPHSKRRLIQLQTGEERQALDRIARLFEHVDCGPDGPEGNYRQRLYRLGTLAG